MFTKGKLYLGKEEERVKPGSRNVFVQLLPTTVFLIDNFSELRRKSRLKASTRIPSKPVCGDIGLATILSTPYLKNCEMLEGEETREGWR